MRHEVGHHLVEQGRINLDAVRESLKEAVGEENVAFAANAYAAAYEGTKMTADEIWEECVCDSLGDMNIFANKEIVGDIMSGILPKIRTAAESEAKSPTQTRGSPNSVSKTSRGTVEEDVATAEKYFGTTHKINEAGYLTINGKLLDFSGKHDGAPGGYRTVDHREIIDAFDGEYGDGSRTGGMIEFMQAGNIRLMPETGGINLSVKPNKSQLEELDRYISNFRGEVVLDIDDANGNTVVSIEYPKHTYSKRIINDINGYFDDGTMPEQPSYLGQFRYSRETVDGQKNTYFGVKSINEESANNATSRGDIVLSSTQDVKKAIESSLNNGKLQKNYILGAINNSVKSKIEQDVKTDIFKTGEYVFKISSDSIRHIAKHFETVDDITDAICRLYDVVCNYDNVTLVPNNQVRLKFEKKYYDYSFLSVEFASKKTRSLNLVTFYATENNKKIENEIQSPVDTIKSTARGVSSSIDSISQEANFVNRDAKLSRETYAESDREYMSAVESGDMETVQRMVDEAAKAAGYTVDKSYRIDHSAPNASDGYSNSIDKIDKSYSADGSIYSSKAVYYYGEGRSYDRKAIDVIKSARNNPDKMITIYRAVPKNVKDSRLRNGDWAAIVKEYAIEHGERVLDGDYRIIENIVPAKELYSNGDSINEWGYDNGNTSEVYKNTQNNVKLAAITYDDAGNVIPLSERFNEQKSDIRYSRETVDNYTEKDYNDYGWARYNDVLSASENADLRSKFAAAVSKQAKYPKTRAGEYMIEIGDIVTNKIAYMKGTIDNPVITLVLVIDGNNETKLDAKRREIYAIERRGIQRETRITFDTYTSASFGPPMLKYGGVGQSHRYNDRFRADRGGNSRKTSRPKEYIFGEDGSVTEKYSRELDIEYNMRKWAITATDSESLGGKVRKTKREKPRKGFSLFASKLDAYFNISLKYRGEVPSGELS